MKTRWQRWIVWLLPFLVARALVPAGFMLSVGDSGLDLTFCPTVASATEVAAASHHGGAHHAAEWRDAGEPQQHSDHYQASDTGVCPFGVVGGACTVTSFHVADFQLASGANLLPAYTAPPDANRLIRTDRIRGPPVIFLT